MVITYALLTDKDRDAIIKLLVDQYMPHESIVKSLNLNSNEMEAYATHVANVLNDRATIGAFDQDSNILCGVALNSIGQISVTDDRCEVTGEEPEKVQYLIRFDTFTEGLRFDSILERSKCLRHDMLVVHQRYAKRGIGTELSKRSIDLAAERGCQYTISFATSYKSLLIDAQLGFRELNRINLKNYRDSKTNRRVFADADLPDNCVHVMMMDLKKYKTKL